MTPFLEEKLKELLQFAKDHSLAEVSWQEGEQKVFFRRNMEDVEPVPAIITEEPTEVATVDPEDVVTSPMVGTFRRGDGKGRPPFVLEGNHIKPGDRVGLVECMKIPNDVTSFSAGVIKKILVEDGQPVEYGQPLFLVSPNDANGTQK